MKHYPLEDRVLILQDEGQDVTQGGIIVPEAYKQKPASGRIVEIGPGKPELDRERIGYFVNGEFTTSLKEKDIKITDRVEPVYATGLLIGDHVYFSQFAGCPVMVDGVQHLILRFTDIISRDD